LLAPEPRTGTDAELLKKLQRGDNAAWAQVTRDFSPRLYSYLRQNLPTVEDAEDVLSETLTAAVRSVANFDGRAALSTYLYAIAYRKVADFYRRTPSMESLDSEGSTVVLVSKELGLQDRMLFEEAMQSLPELSRQVLLLRYHVGLGVDEIATVLDRSYKGTESLLSRARAQMREAMEDSD
jgi:RNA polymerase sigma-70 factor, ECF subfamily